MTMLPPLRADLPDPLAFRRKWARASERNLRIAASYLAGVTIVACVQERYRWWRVDVSIRWRTATLGL